MTYCLGMLCRTGAVFLSDSRTSAGMDNITMRSKMRVYRETGRASHLHHDLRQPLSHSGDTRVDR